MKDAGSWGKGEQESLIFPLPQSICRNVRHWAFPLKQRVSLPHEHVFILEDRDIQVTSELYKIIFLVY